MVLPPGPRAPALWQTQAWMSRPGAFLTGVHQRFGDPVTIRTYWTEEGDSELPLLLAQRDEDGRPPTDQHLRDQLVALLMGGHDSTAASLAWAFERLARTPAVEMREVLRAAANLTIRPLRPQPERTRRSMLVVVPDRGGEVLVG